MPHTRNMTTTRTTWITFKNDKNGKRRATYFYQGRNFPIALDRAIIMIATGEAKEDVA